MEKETHHDDAETTQERVYKSLSKEHTIRHVTYPGETLAANVLKANRIAHLLCDQERFRIIKLAKTDLLAYNGTHLMCSTSCYRGDGDTAGLCAGYDSASRRPPRLVKVLRNFWES
jgi:hypothetical protein